MKKRTNQAVRRKVAPRRAGQRSAAIRAIELMHGYDSIANAAARTGIPTATLKSAKRAGCPAFRSTRFYLLDFIGWYFTDGQEGLSGSLEQEKIRLTRAEANVKELEERRLRGELIEVGGAEHLYTEALLPIRQRLIALPSEACARANPSDPQLAREALQSWVDDALPLIRDQLPRTMKSDGEIA